jgi:hypothetical protein
MSSNDLGVLARLTMGFNKFGNIEIITEGVDPGEFVERFDEWDPEYANTHDMAGLQRLAIEIMEMAKHELTDYVNNHEKGNREKR